MQSSTLGGDGQHYRSLVDPELGVYGLESALASVPITKEAPDPGPGFLGLEPRSPQGHIRGHNLHETEDNSDHLKPHGNAKTGVGGSPVT